MEPQQSAVTAEPQQSSAQPESGATGVMQPKWTMIDGVRDCVGTILSNYACTPTERPAQCSEKAWQELTALSNGDQLTPCALEPDIMDCTSPVEGDANSRCFPAQRPTSCPDEKWERVKSVELVYACGGS